MAPPQPVNSSQSGRPHVSAINAPNTQPAVDAVILDTTGLSVGEVVESIAELVEARR